MRLTYRKFSLLFQQRLKASPADYRRLRRVEIQPLIGKMANKLPIWQGRLLSIAGRLTLTNSVLSSQPIYHLSAFNLNKWAIKKTDKIRRGFLWKIK